MEGKIIYPSYLVSREEEDKITCDIKPTSKATIQPTTSQPSTQPQTEVSEAKGG
jgi:hypothetical protein